MESSMGREYQSWRTKVLKAYCVINFPGGSGGKASAYNAGDLGSIPGSGRSPGEGNGNPLQYSCLENPMDGGTWLGYSPWGRKESNTTEWLHSLTPWKESYDQPRQHIKKKRYHFANKGLSSQGYGFSSSHVWMWELDHKEIWVQKIDAFELWCWRRLLRVL